MIGQKNILLSMLKAGLDILIPPRCLKCSTLVDIQGTLCPSCWASITFIDSPLCERCGFPFEHDMEGEALCGACIEAPPLYEKARSLMVYNQEARDLILYLKHGDGTHLAPYITDWMLKFAPEAYDLIVPVPLHWTRLFWRSYNQSALLGNALSKSLGIPTLPDALVRQRRTPSQGGLSRKGRNENVKGAFAANKKHISLLKGKAILLVDDVWTTGATVIECAKVLKKAGATSIYILTIARAMA